MPGFDGTGPMGYGPQTGGGRGPCNSVNVGNQFGRGFYQGRGGRGFRFRRGNRGGRMGRRMGMMRDCSSNYSPYLPADEANEIDMLKAQADYMKNSLDMINKRIDEMEKEDASKE